MEEIEVLEDDFNDVDNVKSDTTTEEHIIGLDSLFSQDEQVVDAYEDDLNKERLRQKKITKIQIGLIIFLVISASLIYFFGYDLIEPFIKIE